MVEWRPTSFEEWQSSVPQQMLSDPLWNYVAYPKGLFVFDLAWFDCGKLMEDLRGRALLGQLITAAGSISVNIEEGYSKGFGADYARYLKIALGSAREARGWYWRTRRLLSAQVVKHRMEVLSEIIALLKTTNAQQGRPNRKK